MSIKIHPLLALITLGTGIFLFIPSVQAQTPLYIQPPASDGIFFQSSSNGSDYDQFVWDDFTLSSGATIVEIDWFGLYNPFMGGSGGPVTDFQVAVYASIAAGN